MIFAQHVDDRKVNAFTLSPAFIEQFQGKQPEWGPVGYFTYKRTYARALAEGGNEEFWQTCQRVVEGCFNIQKIHCRQMGLPWDNKKAQRSAQEMFERMWAFKFTPPGRGLAVMGTDLVYNRGSAALQNCAFVSSEGIAEDFADPFCFLMDMSMLGVGVGGDTRGAGKVRIFRPRLDGTFVVEDSREGWVELVRVVLNSFVHKGSYPEVIDYSGIRGRGALLKTLGGVASGPLPLQKLVEGITRILMPKGVKAHFEVPYDEETGKIGVTRVTFKGRREPKPHRIGSADIVDVFNYVGKCVVAGGVRRTAEIMFGEHDDQEFITLKQDQEALEDRRWASNNSVFAYVGMDYSGIVDSIAQNGEPGLCWLANGRAYSRMADPPDNKDWRMMGTNPCVTGDTLTMTSEGPRRVDKLEGTPFKALLYGVPESAPSCDTGFFVTGTKPVYLLKTKEGHTLKLTEDHKVQVAVKRTRKKTYIEDIPAGDLTPGDEIQLGVFRGLESWEGQGRFDEGWLLGVLLGDGHFHKEKNAVFQFWGDTAEAMLGVCQKRIETLGGDPRYHKQRTGTEVSERSLWTTQSVKAAELAESFGISTGFEDGPSKALIDDHLLLSSSEFHKGFLRGLFDADGSVQGSQEKGVSVRLASSTMQHLVYAQKMLLALGINSTIYENRREAGEALLPDGKGGQVLYKTKAQHELVVAKENLYWFEQRVGFDEPDKKVRLAKALASYKRRLNSENFLATFESLTYIGVEQVWDCTVPEGHHFSANGFIVHNCGEQGLESFELCVSGDTPLQTRAGVPSIRDCVGHSVEVWNGDGWSAVKPRVTGEGRELFRVTLSDGSYLDCTSNHGWHVRPVGKRVFRRVETSALSAGSQVIAFGVDAPIEGTHNPIAFEAGLFTGDGCISRSSDQYAYPVVIVCGDKAKLRDLDVQGKWWKAQEIEGYTDPVNRLSLHGLLEVGEAQHLNDKAKGLSPSVFGMDCASILEFVAGWIEADGAITGKGTQAEGFRVYGAEPKMRDLQLLLRRVGIDHATVRLFAEEGEETNFGVRNYGLWYCQIPSYECEAIPTRLKVLDNIGPRTARNNAHPEGAFIDRARKQKVVRVEKLEGLHTTYCFEEPENHMAVFGNVLTYQCNLVETYPGHHDDYEDFERTLKMAYLYAKTVTLVPTHVPKANAVMTSNRRIGCSMSGIAQAMEKLGRRSFLQWCDKGYGYVQRLDRIYSRWLGIPLSIKTTTVKPSGTVSLLCGATPGIHYAHSEFYIRHIRVQNTSPLVEAARKAGHPVHPDPYADDTSVIAFPVKEKHFRKGKAEATLWEQFVNAADMQKHWADNQVSCTVTFTKDEVRDLQPVLEAFEDRLKGISLLPLADGDHGYKFAPYQEISEDQYLAMVARCKPIDFGTDDTHDRSSEDKFCTGENCTLEIGPK